MTALTPTSNPDASQTSTDVANRSRAAEKALLEAAELSELMAFSEFQRHFEGKLREWSGCPSQIALEDGRKINLIPFDFDRHDEVKIYPAFSESCFWKDASKFFDLQKFPNGVVIGIYHDDDIIPQKKIVMIPEPF